jgi:hypothetical protein
VSDLKVGQGRSSKHVTITATSPKGVTHLQDREENRKEFTRAEVAAVLRSAHDKGLSIAPSADSTRKIREVVKQFQNGDE